MAARITIERLLRDDDDDSGQTIREWKIESECYGVTIRMRCGDDFIMLRTADVDQFVADILRAKEAALSLAEERG